MKQKNTVHETKSRSFNGKSRGNNSCSLSTPLIKSCLNKLGQRGGKVGKDWEEIRVKGREKGHVSAHKPASLREAVNYTSSLEDAAVKDLSVKDTEGQ